MQEYSSGSARPLQASPIAILSKVDAFGTYGWLGQRQMQMIKRSVSEAMLQSAGIDVWIKQRLQRLVVIWCRLVSSRDLTEESGP